MPVDNLNDQAISIALKGEPIGFAQSTRNTSKTFQAIEQLMEAGLWEAKGLRHVTGLGKCWMYGPKAAAEVAQHQTRGDE